MLYCTIYSCSFTMKGYCLLLSLIAASNKYVSLEYIVVFLILFWFP